MIYGYYINIVTPMRVRGEGMARDKEEGENKGERKDEREEKRRDEHMKCIFGFKHDINIPPHILII